VANERVRKEFTVVVESDLDFLAARRQTRSLVLELGFSTKDVTGIVTAVSELTRNMLMYANGGDLTVRSIEKEAKQGVQIIARDRGPGIPDVRRALLDGYSTSGSLGMGLPGVRRLMDDFKINSVPKEGTVIDTKKWLGGENGADNIRTEG
jgi:serine/threonine-protein kinase RsbT